MKKKITALLFVAMMVSMLAVTGSAATTGKVTKIYGTETRAFACGGFNEFYTSKMFIWVQLDTDISCASGVLLQNQQVLGDTTLKPACNDKIKIGGLTVKQLNAASGNPYSAMVAYEANGSGKIRISIWLSWGGESIQDIFKKEVHPTVTLEVLSGMKVPANGYSMSNKVYADIAPIKYQLSIADLEFLADKTNAGYDDTKKDWVKPMFEDLTAQWTVVSNKATPTPTKPATSSKTSVAASSNATSTTNSTPTDTSSQTDSTSIDESAVSTDSETPSADSSMSTEESTMSETSATDSNTSKADDEGTSAPILPIILGIIGVLVLGGGIGYFFYLKRKGA